MNERAERIINNLEMRNLKYPKDMDLFDEEADMRKTEDIAARAIISAIMAKCAFYLYEAENPDAVKAECIRTLKRFGVQNRLFENERAVLNEEFDESLCDTVGWRYEAANALLWALGFLEDVAEADEPEDVEAALNHTFDLINAYENLTSFVDASALRGEEELLDAFQLYWYYLWNVRDGMIFGDMPETISYDVVLERRRALQWLVFSDETDAGDWEIHMDT